MIHPRRRDILRLQGLDPATDEHVHQSPEEDVGSKHDVNIHIVYQDDVQYEETERNPDDRVPGLTYGHSQGHEFVVDVAPVRGEGAALVDDPVDKEPHDIQHRHEKDCESIYEIV